VADALKVEEKLHDAGKSAWVALENDFVSDALGAEERLPDVERSASVASVNGCVADAWEVVASGSEVASASVAQENGSHRD
jgi:hypothetical protein